LSLSFFCSQRRRDAKKSNRKRISCFTRLLLLVSWLLLPFSRKGAETQRNLTASESLVSLVSWFLSPASRLLALASRLLLPASCLLALASGFFDTFLIPYFACLPQAGISYFLLCT
jgi:hypothetical protein